MEDKEVIFEDRLLSTLKNHRHLLRLSFESKDYCSKEVMRTEAVLLGDTVSLNLNQNDSLNVWFDALNHAESLLPTAEKVRNWKLQNPVFHERIKAKVANLYDS